MEMFLALARNIVHATLADLVGEMAWTFECVVECVGAVWLSGICVLFVNCCMLLFDIINVVISFCGFDITSFVTRICEDIL
jgi:hypothetical protein